MTDRASEITQRTHFDRFAESTSRFTSMLAFLLIALLQNSERRYDRALHANVDALAEGVAVILRHQRTGETADIERALADLDATHSLEDRI